MSGSGVSWAICKSASRPRQITTPVPHHSSFFTGRMPFLPPNQQCQSTEGNQSTEGRYQYIKNYNETNPKSQIGIVWQGESSGFERATGAILRANWANAHAVDWLSIHRWRCTILHPPSSLLQLPQQILYNDKITYGQLNITNNIYTHV